MVRIYTRSGDDGTTGLGTGERVRKDSKRVAAFGAVDEANATIGLARAHLAGDRPELDAMLARIQNDLFDLGADLCMPQHKTGPGASALRITQAQVDRLESEIDLLTRDLKPLRTFILPGGSLPAAALHLARTVARRAERQIVELTADAAEPVSAELKKYVNRLSDFLFVAARAVNGNGDADVLWVQGQNR